MQFNSKVHLNGLMPLPTTPLSYARLTGTFLGLGKCHVLRGFPGGSEGKESACNVGDITDVCLIPLSERSSVERNGNPFQYFCLENPMDRGAWWAPVYMVAKGRTQLCEFALTHVLRVSGSAKVEQI